MEYVLRTACHIPTRHWRQWLEAVAASPALRVIESEGDLALHNERFRREVRSLGLLLEHLTDVVPASVLRGLFDMPPERRRPVLGEMASILRLAEADGVRTVDLDLGLDGLQMKNADAALAERRQVLLACLGPSEVLDTLRVCLPVRVPPPFPGSRAREWAANLLFEAMQSRLALSFDLFPGEWETPPDPAVFVRETCLHAAVLRVHWRPDRGEVLPRRWLCGLAEALHRRAWKGTLVFRPHLRAGADAETPRKLVASLPFLPEIE